MHVVTLQGNIQGKPLPMQQHGRTCTFRIAAGCRQLD